MAVQILSDLHLGFPKTYAACVVPPKAPYLALLGNIGNVVPHKNEFLTFLTTHLRLFKAVLFVPGNHEAYHSNWEDTLAALRVFEEQVKRDDSLGHFQVLDRGTYRPPGSDTVILGCSLFSHVPQESQMAVEMGIIDFCLVEDWSVAKHNKAHQRDIAWLNDEVAKLEECRDATSIIILTHWSPSRLSGATDPEHIGSPIISVPSTDLTNERCFGSVKVKVWAFGQTRYNCDIGIEREGGAGTLRLVVNQRGYSFKQLDGFDVEKTILL